MEVANLLKDLIAVPSVNPGFLPEGEPRAGEAAVAELIETRARQAGLTAQRQRVSAGRDNLIIRLSPRGKARGRILLAPHMDTVPTSAEGFAPRRKGGRLYGRGACDTKGSIAVMLTVLTRLASQRQRPAKTEIVLAALVDEEFAQRGSRRLAAARFKADFAIVGEPTRSRVVTAHKGDAWLAFEARGKSAHGARPELGRNAVHEMARAIDLLETRYAASLGRRRHPLLGPATINVGLVRGGTQANIVPDACYAEADRRTLPGETERSVLREVKALFASEGLNIRCRSAKGTLCHALETDPEHPLVRQLMAAAGQSAPEGVSYFCDAGVLAHAGIPSVVFGPGDIAQAHTADEWIALRELDRASAILMRFLEARP